MGISMIHKSLFLSIVSFYLVLCAFALSALLLQIQQALSTTKLL